MLPTATSQHSARRVRLQALRGRVGLGLVAGLSVLAGMTDAIGLLALGDFVSFMSGNTTRLAVAISQADLALMLRLALAILSFVLGNTLGVLLARRLRRRAAPLLLITASLLAFAAAWPAPTTLPALIAATLAMGMLNAVVEQVNGLPIGLTYVTGALSRFGRGLGRWLLVSGAMAGGYNWCPGAACCWVPRSGPGCSNGWACRRWRPVAPWPACWRW